MSEQIEMSRTLVYDTRDLTPERRTALTLKCDDAYARATLRKLRAAILFAMSAPDGLPVYDEDTGVIGPQRDYDVVQPIRNLLARAMHYRTTWAILTELGWNERMCCADWETMLQHLPAERFRPLPWPGQKSTKTQVSSFSRLSVAAGERARPPRTPPFGRAPHSMEAPALLTTDRDRLN